MAFNTINSVSYLKMGLEIMKKLVNDIGNFLEKMVQCLTPDCTVKIYFLNPTVNVASPGYELRR